MTLRTQPEPPCLATPHDASSEMDARQPQWHRLQMPEPIRPMSAVRDLDAANTADIVVTTVSAGLGQPLPPTTRLGHCAESAGRA